MLGALLFLLAQPAQTANVHERAGRDLESAGKLEQAAAEYERAVQLDPSQEQYYFEAAHAFLLLQRFDSAVTILERGSKTFPKSAQLELALGVGYYGQRRFADATVAFLRTIDLAPEVEQPYVFLGKMLDQAGDKMPQVVQRFRKWAAANPSDPRAQFIYARGLIISGGDSAEAERLLRASIALKGDQWESHYELGTLLEQQRKYLDAAAELERGSALNPSQPDIHYHLSRVYDRLGESDKAAEQRGIHGRLTAPAEVK
ncbi:MAG TPA: tetratricopeptide repeat protein [Bryobacteraceae bacterium]|nr:tetratricopeptide repeat protein [Bryobacteraceae bacterium]